jgi:tRNA (guanine-N7-)-methyltransferase
VNPEMVETIARHLARKGRVFIQTDIEFLADEMFELFRSDERFTEAATAENPFPVRTERERAVEEKGLSIFRASFLLD